MESERAATAAKDAVAKRVLGPQILANGWLNLNRTRHSISRSAKGSDHQTRGKWLKKNPPTTLSCRKMQREPVSPLEKTN
jgi:hypothetical protein